MGVDLIDTYLNNLAVNTRLMDGCNASLWIWYSTDWLPENDCLHMLLDRAMEYYPYVWNDSHCLDHEVLEAEFWHNFLMEIDYLTFQRHRALNLLANTND